MLKWTLQKSLLDNIDHSDFTIQNETPRRKFLRKRKRNFKYGHIITSTPLNKRLMKFSCSTSSVQNSSFSSPLKSILNLTPDIEGQRHYSSSLTCLQLLAPTLPTFEEEYSPNAVTSSGQALAIRGLLPDKYLTNPRYLNNIEKRDLNDSLSYKRERLKNKFENNSENIDSLNENNKKIISSKIRDSTLNKWIDSVLESGCKSEKRKSKKNLTLRRKVFLRNYMQTGTPSNLSPSYAPAEDPASDLTFSEIKEIKNTSNNESDNNKILKTNNKNPILTKNIINVPKFKQKDCSYFEIGLELPSINV